MIGPLGRLGEAATLGQHCPQMTQRPGNALGRLRELDWKGGGSSPSVEKLSVKFMEGLGNGSW